jgi:hypothetical protein
MVNDIQCCFKRVEKKYLLTPQQYEKLVQGIAPYVKPDTYSNYSICNIYYDTDDYQLIRSSLEKPIYKEKLRMRSYGIPGDNDKVFIELKKKFDGVVYKRRVVMGAKDAVNYIDHNIQPTESGQVNHEIDWFMKSYQPKPKVFISYDREAYAGIEIPDLRITFDTNLRWRETELDLRCGNYGAPLLDDEILMEIKIPGSVPLWLAHMLSDLKIFPGTFSKYGEYYKKNILGKSTQKEFVKEAQVCA